MKKSSLLILSLFLVVILLFFTLSNLIGCKSSVQKTLNVYVWEGYLSDEIIDLFEQETAIKLNVNYISENAVMLAFLKGGGKADILMPTQSHTRRFYDDNLGQPLDLERIKNYKNVIESFKDQNWSKWDGNQMGYGYTYVIPYVFGISGLAINTSKYTKSLDNIGWGILLDTNLKGRVSSMSAPSDETLSLLIDYNGIPRENLITETQDTLDSVWDDAVSLKNNVLKFYRTGAEIIDLLKNEEVWVSFIWDGGGREMVKYDAKFKFILPKEGGLAWTDTFIIPKNAENPEGAYLFIDFMLRPDIAAMVTEHSGFNTTVDGALDISKVVDKNLYRLTDEEMKNLKWSPNLPEEVEALYLEFWEKLSTVE